MVSEIVQLVTMMPRKTGQAEQCKCRSRRRADALALAVVTMSKDEDEPEQYAICEPLTRGRKACTDGLQVGYLVGGRYSVRVAGMEYLAG